MNCGPGFNAPLRYRATTASSNPLQVNLRYTSDTFNYGGGGNPVFGQVNTVIGRKSATGMDRRANFVNYSQSGASQLGMGHRFTSGPQAGSISRQGLVSGVSVPLGYANCRIITVSSSMVSGSSDLSNYPLTANLTGSLNIPDLRTVANGGLINSSSAYDVAFGPDCSGIGSLLKWEVESYSPTTGDLVAHVGLPTLAHITNTTVGLYYTGSQSSFQSTVSAVWDTNYKGVYHLSTSVSSIVDSTTSANTMSPINTPTNVAGQVNGAVGFVTASTQWATANSSAAVTTFPLTIEGWAKLSSATLVGDQVIASVSAPSSLNEFWIGYLTPNFIRMISNAGGTPVITECTITPDTNWHHIVGEVTNASTSSIYMDGALLTSGCTTSGTQTPSGLSSTNIGGFIYNTSTNYGNFGGSIDEVRYSNILRSADWIKTEYRNAFAPATYLSIGSRINPSSSPSRYSLSWWMDGWDHGGITLNPNRPVFRDVLATSSNAFVVYKSTNGGFDWVPGYGAGSSLTATGPIGLLLPTFTDTVMQSNSSWSFVGAFNTSGTYAAAGATGAATPLFFLAPGLTGTSAPAVSAIQFGIYIGLANNNDVCVRWGTNTVAATYVCTPASAVPTGNSITTVQVSAAANATGIPTLTILVSNSGTTTQYGPANLAVSATGTTIAGLTKTCTSCSATPNISATTYWVAQAPTNFGQFNTAIGEIGLYSGAVPSGVMRSIYRALKADWLRTGRGTL